jgi:mycothiol synthase
VSVSVRRARTSADIARSIEIFNEVWPQYAVTPEEVESWKRQAIENVDLLASVDGVDVGSAVAAADERHPRLCFTLITVLPEHRRRGAGSALCEHVELWATERTLEAIETLVKEDDDESLQFGLRRGFAERSRDVRLELDVARADVSVPRPEGFEVVLLAARPDLGEGTWDVAAEAIPDVPGNAEWTPPSRERWVGDFLLDSATPPEAVYVAAAGDEVIGYAKLRLKPDGRGAVHGMTAVRRAWRGRGVATALKLTQIAWAKSQGLEQLITEIEVRNAPMQRINERLGYMPAPGRIHLRKSLPPA